MDNKTQNQKNFIKVYKTIEEFIKERGYTYSVGDIYDFYINYIKVGQYVPYSITDIMDNVGEHVIEMANIFEEAFVENMKKCLGETFSNFAEFKDIKSGETFTVASFISDRNIFGKNIKDIINDKEINNG